MSSTKKPRISKYNTNENIYCKLSPALFSKGQVKESCSETENSFSLTDLPNEIILLIFEYLNPSDLITFTKVDNKRLGDLTYSVESVNFSSCHKVDEEGVRSYFCRNRVKLIKRINFRYTKYLRPKIITGIACRCKNLIELSIVKCNITYKNIIAILMHCKILEKLSCDIFEFEEIKFIHEIRFPAMKTVNLFVEVLFYFNFGYLHFVQCFLSIFPNMESAWINFTFNAILTLPVGHWVKISGLTNSKCNKRQIMIINGFEEFENCNKNVQRLKVENSFILKNQSKQINSCQSLSENNSDSETFVFSTYAQIKSNLGSLTMFASDYSNKISSISILLTHEVLSVSEKLVECVNNVAGTQLKKLSFQEVKDLQHKSEEETLVICDVIKRILIISTYLTDLNLFSVHFDKVSPFAAVCKLKFLKTLDLPSCAFPESFDIVRNENGMSFQLKDVVKGCPLVEYFSLTFCSTCSKELENGSVIPIQGWKDLKKLSLYYIPLQSFYFLRKVSESCHKLESLSFFNFTCCTAIYVPDIIYFLKNVKSLKFIQINDYKFNPMYERFWDVISECVNLEGIDISTEFPCYIEKQKILRAVEKLQYLQTFLFSAPRVSEQLYADVKKSLHKNGIVNFSVLKKNTQFHSYFREPYHVHRPLNYSRFQPHWKLLD